jgi:Glycosyl transferases group 1
MPSRTRRALSKALLRGPALSAWTRRQYGRLDRAYVQEVVRSSEKPVAPPVKPRLALRSAVRTILVIADCMWEQNELVPDLQRQWSVSLLDLNPELRKPSALSDAEKSFRAVESFIGASRDLRPDVILLYARSTLLSDELFDALRKAWKCPIVGMNLDDKVQFFNYGIFSAGEDNYQAWAGKFDLNLTNTLAAVPWYHQRGFACLYSPQGVNLPDDLPEPGPKAHFKHVFSFVGSSRLERARIINRLRELKIPITLFGTKWPESQWADDPTGIYRSSQINLGIGLCTATETQTTVKGRDFECPGVGACYLTTYNWELVHHWELGKEILCYRSVEELVEIFSCYRGRPEECLKIAQAAFRRSRAEHTWRKRFERVFRELGLKN